jgi:hypothetical protein
MFSRLSDVELRPGTALVSSELTWDGASPWKDPALSVTQVSLADMSAKLFTANEDAQGPDVSSRVLSHRSAPPYALEIVIFRASERESVRMMYGSVVQDPLRGAYIYLAMYR